MMGKQDAMKKLAAHAVLAVATAENVPSPCLSVCRMDARAGVCEGCLRTIDEIRMWSSASDVQKKAVWAMIAQRIAAQAPSSFSEPQSDIHLTP
jgi:predicted Fe-S protein YdhL (DUF1289 family)